MRWTLSMGPAGVLLRSLAVKFGQVDRFQPDIRSAGAPRKQFLARYHLQTIFYEYRLKAIS
jgi:hypothetical protein